MYQWDLIGTDPNYPIAALGPIWQQRTHEVCGQSSDATVLGCCTPVVSARVARCGAMRVAARTRRQLSLPRLLNGARRWRGSEFCGTPRALIRFAL